MKKVNSVVRSLVAASVLAVISLAAHAERVHLKANLTASAVVPATTSNGTGTLTATLNTKTNELKYHIEFSGLTGEVTAAHFHGPADEGANAGPQLPIKTKPITSPIDGTATLTPDQTKDLLAGKWYFNLHTAANPHGEIRGQVTKSE